MASQAVKEKLHGSILRRQSLEQQKAQRETGQSSELDLKHEPPNTLLSLQHKASDFALKHKATRCSSRRKASVHNSFPSRSYSFSTESSSPSDQSHVCYYSVQQFPQMDRNLRMNTWVPAPLTVPHQNIYNQLIVVNHVHTNTALFNSQPQLYSPQLDVLPEVSIIVRPHRPLHGCQSQPLILNQLPIGIFEGQSLRVPGGPSRSTQTRPLEAEESIAAQQDTENVMFMLGDANEKNSEFSAEHTSAESSCSAQHKWRRRPALRKHKCLQQTLRHVCSAPSTFILRDTDDHAPDHAHKTGLLYDPKMLTQQCICDDVRCGSKHAGRIPVVFNTLQERGVSNQCKWLTVIKETCRTEFVDLLHQSSSFRFYGADRLSHQQQTALSEAAGSVINLMKLITQGQLRNGFAILQPFGDDACTSLDHFSPVAIAAKQFQQNNIKRKILILDWDVHHSNMTQEMFYTDPNILHISLHRHGNATPPAGTGRPEDVGLGDGEGFNVNVEWSCDQDASIGDAEYLAAFRTVIKPIALQFRPDFILISTQFNSVQGHPTSPRGTRVSAQCFGLLTQNLMELCGGRMVVVLQRGHDVMAVCEASTECVSALLKDQVATLPADVLMKKPCAAAVQSLRRVLQIHSQYWPSVRALIRTVGESWLRAECKHSTDTTSALALLSMTTTNYSSSEKFGICRGGNEPVEHDEDETL